MREPWNWEESHLLDMIRDQKEESLNLDYKRSDALGKTDKQKIEISKDVSAFANSDGGTLVYGMIEDGHLPTGIDGGCNPSEISREWLEDVITSNIHPKISGFRIKPVALNSHAPGKVAYVVHVPQSTTAHMAADKRYYKRYNFKAQPMEDYEVRDVMRRKVSPDLSLKIRLIPTNQDDKEKNYFTVKLRLDNASDAPAEHALLFLALDGNIEIKSQGDMRLNGSKKTATYRGRQIPVSQLAATAGINSPGHLPIFKGVTHYVVASNLVIGIPKYESCEYLLCYDIHAPLMERKCGCRLILPDGKLIQLSPGDRISINDLR